MGLQQLQFAGSRAQAQQLLLCGMWDLPAKGTEPVSLALAARFFTTEPTGKPTGRFLNDGLDVGLRVGAAMNVC